MSETEEVQLAGTLDETTIGTLVKLVRECNVTLHWILLHTAMSTILLEDSKRSRMLRQLVANESKYTTTGCLQLLLSTAQIEQDVKQLYKDVGVFDTIVAVFAKLMRHVSLILLFAFSCCLVKKLSGSGIKEYAPNA